MTSNIIATSIVENDCIININTMSHLHKINTHNEFNKCLLYNLTYNNKNDFSKSTSFIYLTFSFVLCYLILLNISSSSLSLNITEACIKFTGIKGTGIFTF